MSEFLRKLKLIDNFTIELKVSKNDFVTKLKENVVEASVDPFFEMFDLFSSNKKEYKGRVNFEKFEIKRRAKFFDSTLNLAVAKGSLYQKEDRLIIEAEINGFPTFMLFPLFIMVICYALFFFFLLVSYIQDDSPFLWSGPFIFFHGIFMFGIPYLIMRRSTSRLKYDLEREFHFLTRASN